MGDGVDAKAPPGLGLVLERIRAYGWRYLLAGLGIAVGTASMVFLTLLVGSGFSAATRSLRAMGSNVVFVSSDTRLSRGGADRRVSLADVKALERASLSGVLAVTPIASLSGVFSACGKEVVVQIMGVTPPAFALHGWSTTGGRSLSWPDNDLGNSVVVVGSGVASQLPCRIIVGSEALLSERRVTDVCLQGSQGRGWLPGLDSIVIVPFSVLEARYGNDLAASALVRIASEREIETVSDGIYRVLQASSGIARSEIVVQSQAALVNAMRSLEFVTYGVVVALTILAVLVAAIGVMNAVMTAVVERTPEIGLRRAVGAGRVQIGIQFLGESFLVSLAGALLGVGVGVLSASIVLRILDLSLDARSSAVIVPFTLAVLFGSLAGVWPASRAAHLSPVDALRHE